MSTVRDRLVEIMTKTYFKNNDFDSPRDLIRPFAEAIEAEMVRGDISCIDCFRYEDGVPCKYSCATIKGFIVSED